MMSDEPTTMKDANSTPSRASCLILVLWLVIHQVGTAQWITSSHTGQMSITKDSIDPVENRPLPAQATAEIILGARIEPLVIRRGLDTYRLMVMVDPTVKGLQLHTSGMLTRDSDAPDWLRLYDDGTSGDEVAGDKRFTLDSLTLSTSILPGDTLPLGGVTLGIGSARIEYEDGSTSEWTITFYPSFQWIDPARITITQVHDIAPGVRASDYCMNVLVDPDPSVLNETAVIQKYFAAGGEEKDFLFLETPFYSWGISGYSVTISNDVQGIGVGIFDDSPSYGSQGKLKSYIRTFSMSLNPVLLNHELLHHWAAFLDASFDFGLVHWGAIERPTTGFGNYWGAYTRFEAVSPRLYRAYLSDPDAYYNDLELYLMGLGADSEVVSPIRAILHPFAGNFGTDPITHESYREITGETIKEVTMQDIIAVHGPRIPAVKEAQKEFSSALIVAYDRALSAVEFSYFDYLMRQYEQAIPSYRTSFGKATRGRASMSTRLSASLQLPDRVQLSSPPDRAELGSDTVRVCWIPSSPSVSRYWLEYATDSLFVQAVVDSSLTDTTYVIIGVQTATMYWWRVKAWNASGWGPMSEIRRFSTVFTGIANQDDMPSKFELFQNYPNPFNPRTVVRSQLPVASNVKLVVYDLLGREVAVLVEEWRAAGYYKDNFDASNLASGVYIYRLTARQTDGGQAGSFVQSRKMLLVR